MFKKFHFYSSGLSYESEMKLFYFHGINKEYHLLFKEIGLFLYNSSMLKDMELKNDCRY